MRIVVATVIAVSSNFRQSRTSQFVCVWNVSLFFHALLCCVFFISSRFAWFFSISVRLHFTCRELLVFHCSHVGLAIGLFMCEQFLFIRFRSTCFGCSWRIYLCLCLYRVWLEKFMWMAISFCVPLFWFCYYCCCFISSSHS